MNPNEKINGNSEKFLYNEAIKLSEKAMTDNVAHDKLITAFDKVCGENESWKESFKVHLQDSTGFWTAMGELLSHAIRYAAAFIFFTGGCEIAVNNISDIEVSTKGYYHYIGA